MVCSPPIYSSGVNGEKQKQRAITLLCSWYAEHKFWSQFQILVQKLFSHITLGNSLNFLSVLQFPSADNRNGTRTYPVVLRIKYVNISQVYRTVPVT